MFGYPSRETPFPRPAAPRRAALAAVVALALGGAGCSAPEGDQAAGAGDAEALASLAPPPPVVLQVPAGTPLAVRFIDTVSSHQSPAGARFATEVAEPVIVEGAVVIPVGSRVVGTVVEARAPKIGGRARLALSFHRLELPGGPDLPIEAALVRLGRSEKGKDVGTIAGSVVGGAILGHQVDDDDEGKAVGGAVGGAIGAAIAAATKGKPLVIPAGSVVSLELQRSLSVEIAG